MNKMLKTLLTATHNIATAASSSLSSTLFSHPPNPTLIATPSLLSPATTCHLHHHRTCPVFMILISFFTHYVKSSKQLNCNSNSRGFTLCARYSQAQDVHVALLGWSKVFRRLLGLVGSGLPMYQREPSTNATAVSANLVVDERQMNALFLDVVRC
ncbi:unnamed protein product [Malus baccata var. baccata]